MILVGVTRRCLARQAFTKRQTSSGSPLAA
ncbi:UNVERIFIED_CONTAM: hypothetical protein GTU68_014953 [Idotea baltica]|nr:hypothetical protein [Idotea baltica]